MKTGKGGVVEDPHYFNGRTSRVGARVEVLCSPALALLGNRGARSVAIAAGVVLASLLPLSFLTTAPVEAQLGSPAFENPPELISSKKRLRGVMEIINGEFSVPGMKTEQYRQFRGRHPDSPPVPGTSVGPGPTLRARLGDQVQISFLNKVDESQFPYTFVTGKDKPPFSNLGCDVVGLPVPPTNKFAYPANDIYPNCFHGSNTANIHFHGTHTTPDGLGDNVLVQVLAEHKQPDWTFILNPMFDSGKIPQKWADLPASFRNAQIAMVKKREDEDRARALKNNLREPEPMSKKNQELIAAGLWPEYFIGIFPNFFDIPDYSSGKYKAGQAPGTHWYHAHKHGSTSLHIRNGLAGTLVIESSQEGGYDHFIRRFYGWGDTYGAHEKIFVFQQYDPTQNLERMPRVPGKGSNQVLINGKLTPTITMRPGEVQLWRFVNATQGNTAGVINIGNNKTGPFNASEFKFVQTAQDGVQFGPDNYKTQPYLNGEIPNGVLPFSVVDDGLILAAGNRADVLVQAPQTTGTVPFRSGQRVLFFVTVAGDPVTPEKSFPDSWPEMPKFLNDLPKPGPNDIKNPNSPVKFQWEEGRAFPGPVDPDSNFPPGFPPKFMINGKQFGETGTMVDQCMPQDGLQEWVLENYTNEIAHPFHIHINPFQIIQITSPVKNKTYRPKNNFIWQDVIAIPPADIKTDANGNVTSVVPGRVTIRQAYPDFTGTFVLHCHILAHEDRGMMQLVRIVPLANYPKGCQEHPPDHH